VDRPPSRRIVATMFMTLDGVVDEPHKWSFAYWDDGVAEFKDRELKASDALLLGRVTYEGFAAAWPGRKDETGFADKFNAMPKYVASRTLESLTWTNSHLLEGSLEEAVARLKAEPGGEIAIHGSVGLINELLPHGLIDRFHILVYPLVLGDGKRLFRDGARQSLKLVETKTFPKGVVAMIYDHVPVDEAPKPARNPVYGRKQPPTG
jgi:dihydrofolate reductase